MGQTATSTSTKRAHQAPVLGVVLGGGALIILATIGEDLTWDPIHPTDAIAYVLHRIAALLALWVTASGFIVAWARTAYIGSSIARSVARFAVPWLRRFAVTGATGAIMVTGTLGSSLPSVAEATEPAPVSPIIDLPEPLQDLLDEGPSRFSSDDPPARSEPENRKDTADLKPPPTTVRRDPTPPPEAVVDEGDNLWRISAEHLATLGDAAPTQTQIAEYWQKVIAENRDSLISGDPDLIYPGETIKLPPP